MISKEDIKAQVTKEKLAEVNAETEKRFAHLVAQENLQNCGFVESNLDEVLYALEQRPRGVLYFSDEVPYLPCFRFISKKEIAYGKYSFSIGSVMFRDAFLCKEGTDEEGRDHYKCKPYDVMVKKSKS